MLRADPGEDRDIRFGPVEGTVEMDTNWALEPDEVEKGYVLTCQSHPTSDTVVLDYDA